MFRLLGFLVGSVTSIAALVLLVGRPDFHIGSEETDAARFDAAVEKLKARQAEAQVAAESEPDGDDEAVTAAAQAELPAAPVAEADPAAQREDRADPAAARAGPAPQSTLQPEWHAFWTPFRTEIAARGFVSRLESVTGLDYRVVKVNRGEYQVAFAYLSDDELDDNLALIASATGLDLSGGLP